MQYATDEEKQAWASEGQKQLLLTFSDGTKIDNNDIYYESMSLEQTLCDENNITFGKCSSAVFKVKVNSTQKSYKGLTINPTISVGKFARKLGRFKVVSDTKTSDKRSKELVCYDAIYFFGNRDFSEWYNKLTFPMTIKQFRDLFFEKLGIKQVEIELPNDNIQIEKTVNAETISGLTIVEAICELNACFGQMNFDGKFRYVFIGNAEEGLYPSDDLFPNENLYPRDSVDFTLNKSDYFQGRLTYEDFDVQRITQIKIKEDDEDLGVTVGTEGNTYVIANNFLTYANAHLKDIATNWLNVANKITYTPSEVTLRAMMWAEPGDFIKVIGNMDIVCFPILHRTLSGINALYDTYRADGEEYVTQELNSIETSIEQIKSSQVRIDSDVNGLHIEIEGKVDEEDVVSVINASPETIELKSNRLVVESDNFSLDKDGNVSILGRITGKNEIYLFSSYQQNFFKFVDIVNLGSDENNLTIYDAFGSVVLQADSQTPSGEYGVWFPNNTMFWHDVRVNGTLYTSSGNVSVSDKNLKNSIKELDKSKSSDFIYSLKPCEFKYNDGTSNRFHHGFIAQDIKDSMKNDDWGIYCENKDKSKGIRYEELIADMVSTLQQQHEEIELLKKELSKLKGAK